MKRFVNSLTITRIIGTIILPFLWVYLDPAIFLILVSLILITDFFDGFLARKFNVQTLFGSLLDIIADKVFGIMLLIIIGNYEPIFYLVASLEVAIALINITAAIKGATTYSSYLGKIKMWILGVATLAALLTIFDEQLYQTIDIQFIKTIVSNYMKNEEMITIVIASMTIGAQLMVAIDYLKRISKEIKDSPKKIKYKLKDNEELEKVLFDTKYYLKNKKLPLSKHLLK